MDKFCTGRKAWIFAVGILFLSFLAMNVLTPYVADDYGNLPEFASEGTSSFGEMINAALKSYQNWGGRFTASLFTAIFACLPAFLFDFLNTLAYLLVTALIS